ncbi:MAG: uroporphyrinogen-III C-methyltransferase [Phycisphaeraceae bacterium]|nr:uroporphyrinogen-III C-methyltransferase [Phycisphaeraceae bacterium]
MTNPQVYLVGAGPGDPGLITLKGLQSLQMAQVVVYDALADPALLAEAPATAKRLYVGKRGGPHALTQDQINELLVEESRKGLIVVRLKGGDPYLFGRGAEEASYLARHGIDCLVVPGITSGLAAPAAAGIPVTHRKIASTVTLVTGHEDPTKPDTSIDYRALSQLIASGGTVCFYMGVGRLSAIVASLTGEGLSPRTPAAVVQWGTTPRQRSVRATLDTLAQAVEAAGVSSPAIIVVGLVAAIEEPGLDGFTRRPLFGQRILITRTRHQASELRRQLTDLGAAVLEAPTIDLVEPDNWTTIDEALRNVRSYDWIVLTSVNGVETMAQRLATLKLDSRSLAGVRIAAIGDSTAQTLRDRMGIEADLVPTRFVAESLAGELLAKQDVRGKRFLLLRADIARPALPKLLTEAGAVVVDLCIYQTRRAESLPENVVEALDRGEVDWITFTSASTANNLVELLGTRRNLLDKPRLASIGPITSDAMRALGLTIAVEASRHDIAGLVDALSLACRHEPGA